jgi:16S rRNA (guanine527-N7)-methyltransferase
LKSASFRERFLRRARHANTTVADATVDRFEAYYLLLNHWNKKINLTALRLESLSDHVIDRILVEPLVAAEAVSRSSIEWLDLGSGGGSPAIPIKIVRSQARLTLVEARSRKAAFLREAVRELALADVVVIDERFEKLAERSPGQTADVVTARALRADVVFFDSSRHLLREDGELLLFTTTNAVSMPASGFEWSRTSELIPGAASRLVIFRARS